MLRSSLAYAAGIYAGFTPDKLPATPGQDGVGRIVKSAGKFKEGQRVVAAPWPASKGYGKASAADPDRLNFMQDVDLLPYSYLIVLF